MDFESILFFLCVFGSGKNPTIAPSIYTKGGAINRNGASGERKALLAPHSLAYFGVLVHVVVHLGLAVPDAGVVAFDVSVAATLDG